MWYLRVSSTYHPISLLLKRTFMALHATCRAPNLQVNSGLMAAEDFVRVVSTELARTFNVYPQKGVIVPGSDADVIVFDPKRKHTISAATHHSAMDTNVYEGWTVTGKVRIRVVPMSSSTIIGGASMWG